MMHEFRERIAKAKRKGQLKKIEQEARKQFGIFSKEYAEILELCYKQLETLERR